MLILWDDANRPLTGYGTPPGTVVRESQGQEGSVSRGGPLADSSHTQVAVDEDHQSIHRRNSHQSRGRSDSINSSVRSRAKVADRYLARHPSSHSSNNLA